MRGKRVCRLHGGKGGSPTGKQNGAYRIGRRTAEAKAERRQTRAIIRGLRRIAAMEIRGPCAGPGRSSS
jgi:hypothetical protein